MVAYCRNRLPPARDRLSYRSVDRGRDLVPSPIEQNRRPIAVPERDQPQLCRVAAPRHRARLEAGSIGSPA